MKKFFVYLVALLLGLSLSNAKVWAEDEPKQDSDFQDNPVAVSVSDIEGLNNRISALEKTGSSSFKVSGLLQFWYQHLSYGTEGAKGVYTSQKNQWDAFKFNKGEIGLTANITGDPKLTLGFKIDPTQASFNGLGSAVGPLGYDGSTTIVYPSGVTVNGKNGPTTVTTVPVNPFTIVKDFYGKVSFSPYATLIFGQNKFAQPLEGRWPSGDLDFANLTNVSSGFSNHRDTGVQVEGTGIPLGPIQGEYVLSVIQGSGQSSADNNVDKDLAARVGFTYDKNLFLGTSAYDGWEPNGARWDFGLEGRWIYNGLKIQAEFIEGNLNTVDNNAANNSSWTPSVLSTIKTPTGQINPTGYYLTSSYRYQDWRLGVRWDGYNFNQWKGSLSNTEWDTVTIGLDWFRAKDLYKLSLNWEDHLLAGVEKYNVWTVQSQISI